MGLTRRRFLTGAGGLALGAAGLAAGGCALGARQGQRASVAVLRDQFPAVETATTDAVIRRLRQEGLVVDILDGAAVVDAARLDPGRYQALVLGDARFFPADGVSTLLGYLSAAGRAPGSLVALGGPFLSSLQYQVAGRWGTREQAIAALAAKATPLSLPAASAWQPAGNTPSSDMALSEHSGQLNFQIPNLQGWGNTTVAASFPADHSLLAFQAKGTADTGCFILEWDEGDLSRWIATVHITSSWQSYLLTPEDFAFWPDPPVPGRGGPGDHLRPQNAVKLSLGVDTGHCGAVSGPQQFALRGLGTLPAAAAGATALSLPVLTGLVPAPADDAYEAYTIPGAVHLDLESGQSLVTRLPQIGTVTGAISAVYRPRGLGASPLLAGQPPYRFIPIITARSSDGALRGAPGAVLRHVQGTHAGSTWTLLGLPTGMLQTAAGYAAEFTAQALRSTLGRPWLYAGGSDAVAVPAGLSLPLGATVLLDRPSEDVTVVFSLDGKQVGSQQVGPPKQGTLYNTSPETTLGPGLTMAQVGASTTAPSAAGTPTLTVTLSQKGQTLDTISYPLRVYPSAPSRQQGQVTVQGGEFMADGKPFRPVGINYWPRSTSGLPASLYGQGWLSALVYDPTIIEADLTEMQQLGFNVVSGIQYSNTAQAPALRDFLARCDAHGIRANVFLSGADPRSPNLQQLTAVLQAADLPHDTAVFAYDLAWEPHFGTFANRQGLVGAWGAWVQEQYGSFPQAQQAWGYDGGQQGPEDSQLQQSGPWDAMVAAYRRFADDLITAGYGKVWRAIRSLGDPHLLGARTGYGGTGQMGVVTQMPFDLQSGMLYLGFTSPEGYGLGPAYTNTVGGGFTTAYGRAVGAGKPVFWAEWGASIWGNVAGGEGPQGELYTSIYHMIEASAANGGAGWWFPGGYRVDEHSDFGIFNPDGTPRPAAQATSAAARQMAASGPLPTPDVWIDVDRDQYVQGYAGVWAAFGQSYVQQLGAGHLPGVRLAGSGTTSANCPLTALGGGAYPGFGPLQFLNAAFAHVTSAGVEVQSGASLTAPATLDVTVGNTATSSWAANVALSIRLPDGSVQYQPLPQSSVDYLQLVTLKGVQLPAVHGTVQLRMEARGRAAFGPVFQLQL